MSLTIQFSRRLAITFGILAPLGETIRRWHTWREYPPSFFDDYIMGAFLLYGAWRVGRDARGGQRFLAAAWAFTCGLGYYSFFGQLKSLSLGEVDPAPISSEWMLAIKGVGLALAIIALALSLRRSAESQY
ncbi:MAG TPA: hypothetical protein VEY11_14820 [Pyrinomonadaceae bacterium]|nr:hypothetical protein [Pyrinomonadaceae bacterium]